MNAAPEPYAKLIDTIDRATIEERSAVAGRLRDALETILDAVEWRIIAELAGALLNANERDRAAEVELLVETATVELGMILDDTALYHREKQPPTGDEPPPPEPTGTAWTQPVDE